MASFAVAAWKASESFESLAFHGFFVSRHAQGHPLGQLVHSQCRLSGVGESWSRKIYVGCLDHLCTHSSTHPSMLWGVSSCVAGFTWNVETWRFYSCWAFYSCWTGRDRAAIQAFWRPWNGLVQKMFGPMDSNWTVTVPARRNPSWWLKKHQDTISVLVCQDNVTVGFKHIWALIWALGITWYLFYPFL